MARYISMLRGINVSGQKLIKMDDLKKAYKTSGFQNVRTYIQSGNVIFQTAKTPPLKLSEKISEIIFKKFNFHVAALVKTLEEMDEIVRNNPFLKEKRIDQAKLYVTFLSQPSKTASIKKLNENIRRIEKFYCHGNEVYLYCPDGYGRSKLSNNLFEKVFSSAATTRNWKTVINLHEEAMILSGKRIK